MNMCRLFYQSIAVFYPLWSCDFIKCLNFTFYKKVLDHIIAHFLQFLHLVEQLCLALNDEFRTYVPDILPFCIQVITDAERFNNYSYVYDILHTFDIFGGWVLIFFFNLYF